MTKNLKLNEAFKELEDIVGKFENEEVDLEKAIPRYKRAVELANFLKKRLKKMKNEIEEIKKSA